MILARREVRKIADLVPVVHTHHVTFGPGQAGRSCQYPEHQAVSKHAAGIFGKLDLAPSDDDNRRVLAVLAYLGS